MVVAQSIFLEFNLPNATTWFYFSLLLSVALFFKFSRLLSMRNWDVLTLPLLVPGLLLLKESGGDNWFGYLWLICGSGYLLVRCFIDLTLVSRPALSPNLNLGGLAWLAGALFVCLTAVAVRQTNDPRGTANKTAPIETFERKVEDQVHHQAKATDAAEIDAPFLVSRTLALSCHLAIVVGLVFVGGWHFKDWHAGMAAATFYLLLPYTALDVARWHHVWPMALTVWAVATYRKPTAAGVLLGLAAATTYFPVLVFPVWLSFYWRRGAGRFVGSFALTSGLCLAVIASFLWIDDELASSFRSALSLPTWQPWIEPLHSTQGLWSATHWAYRMPIFIAYLALVVTTAFWPSPKNLAQVLALSAAVLIGIQFWYADQGGIYVLWYLPLLLLLVFRPNLSDCRPLPIPPEGDWLTRLGRALSRLFLRVLRIPEPVARAERN
jgi:hypothetical protein